MPAFPVPVPNVLSAWGTARHFLTTERPFLGESQANNDKKNTTTRSLGEGLHRRGRWLGLLRGLVLEIMTEIISWRFI